MSQPLDGVDAKLRRTQTHINEIYRMVEAFARPEPYTVRVDKDPNAGDLVRRFVAVRNPDAQTEPDVSIVLFAGEIIYQLRSALDHLVHQLVIVNGNAAKLQGSRRHQFPIFESPNGYRDRAGGMIDGVSNHVASLIEGEQPYSRIPNTPRNDMLWVLQDLNNTDKHRIIPTAVVGIGVMNMYEDRMKIGYLQSPDVVLEQDKVFFSVTLERPDQNIRPELHCAVAFAQAMSPYGVTLGIPGVLTSITSRVSNLVDTFRRFFP